MTSAQASNRRIETLKSHWQASGLISRPIDPDIIRKRVAFFFSFGISPSPHLETTTRARAGALPSSAVPLTARTTSTRCSRLSARRAALANLVQTATRSGRQVAYPCKQVDVLLSASARRAGRRARGSALCCAGRDHRARVRVGIESTPRHLVEFGGNGKGSAWGVVGGGVDREVRLIKHITSVDPRLQMGMGNILDSVRLFQ